MTPQIEDYNPYLIGIKLGPGISLDSIKKEMKKVLRNAEDYIVAPEGMGESRYNIRATY